MKVYLVCQEIDLGYHVLAGFLSKERAEALCQYHLEWNRGRYFVEELDVIEEVFSIPLKGEP